MENSTERQETSASKIRALNDRLRTTLQGGQIVMTRGIWNRPDKWDIHFKVINFDAFNEANDPHGEHDFGAIEVDDATVFWQIAYYAKDLFFGSPDPTNPLVTVRVLTIMLAEEY